MITCFDSIPSQASAAWALRFAMSADKHELPVVSSGQFEGIVRIEDLATAVAEGQPDISVGLLCQRQVKHIRFDAPLTVAADRLRASQFAELPVVDALGHLTGLVTRDSIHAAGRFGSLLRTLPPSPLRERPDELRQHLARMQIV